MIKTLKLLQVLDKVGGKFFLKIKLLEKFIHQNFLNVFFFSGKLVISRYTGVFSWKQQIFNHFLLRGLIMIYGCAVFLMLLKRNSFSFLILKDKNSFITKLGAI